jgi:hypothetical protein
VRFDTRGSARASAARFNRRRPARTAQRAARERAMHVHD